MKRALLVASLLLLAGCPNTQLISPYDEAIDKGITDFYEQFNVFVKDLGDSGGKPEGTYDANTKKYNAFESKLDVLILKASSNASGAGCKLEAKVYDKVSAALASQMPDVLKAAGQAKDGNSFDCNTRLLELVKDQVAAIREIHSTTDKCPAPGGQAVSCLRKATSKTALDIINQSIRAVSVVEAAKKNLAGG